MSEDVLNLTSIEVFLHGGRRFPAFSSYETWPRRSILAGIACGYFFELDGKVWRRSLDFLPAIQVFTSEPLPSTPPRNHPPKPETAFWRSAPRRRR